MIFPEVDLTVQACLKRLRRWRVPPHWSCSDWQDEVAAQAQSAAWEALSDYDSSRGVPLSAFVHLRVISRVLTRYRQEWTYAVHCVGETGKGEDETWLEDFCVDLADHPGCSQVYESLRHALILLSAEDRWLVEQLFWAGRTESEVARLRGISQPAINKRKRAILHDLRTRMVVAEKC